MLDLRQTRPISPPVRPTTPSHIPARSGGGFDGLRANRRPAPPPPAAAASYRASHQAGSSPGRRPKFAWLRSKRTLLVALAIALALLSLYASLDTLWLNHQLKVSQAIPTTAVSGTKPVAQIGVADTSHGPVSEAPLPHNSLASYAVAPTAPRIIRIGTLNLSARIMPMGINRDNSLQAPQNIHDTGWYTASGKPGEAGAMLINGHYTGYSGPGILYNLQKLRPGAVISIERGDGKVFKYAVEKVEELALNQVPMDKLLISRNPKAQSLNIITCAGTFKPSAGTYDQRLIVYASAI